MTRKSFTSSSQMQRLVKRLDEFAELLHVDKEAEPFFAGEANLSNADAARLLPWLHQEGAVEQVEKVYSGGTYRHKWKWKPDAKKKLKDYLNKRDELPCGHRAHIFNRTDIGENEYSCKECCKNGDIVRYSEETIKECL